MNIPIITYDEIREQVLNLVPVGDPLGHVFLFSHLTQEFQTELRPISSSDDMLKLSAMMLRQNNDRKSRLKLYYIRMTEKEAYDMKEAMTDFPVRTLRSMINNGLMLIQP